MLLARGARPDLQCHVLALAASRAADGGGQQWRGQEQGQLQQQRQPLGPLLPLLVSDNGNTALVLAVCAAVRSRGGGEESKVLVSRGEISIGTVSRHFGWRGGGRGVCLCAVAVRPRSGTAALYCTEGGGRGASWAA